MIPHFLAPNSPIASAKRPRISKRDNDLKSPSRATATTRGGSNDHNEEAKAKVEVSKPTKGKSQALFSPAGQPQNDSQEDKISTETGKRGRGKGTKNGSQKNSPGDNGSDNEAKYKAAGAEEDALPSEGDDQQTSGGRGEEEVEEEEVFNPYQFISGLPPVTSIARNEVSIPPHQGNKPTLTLDLDETLVHCTVEPIDDPDLIFPVTFNGTLYDVYVRKRPYLDYFLEAVSLVYEVVVFTASQRVYADVLLDLLDPERKYIKHRLFRESCVLVQGNYIKDLHVLGRDYSRTVLVDNSPHAYGFQIENGVPIESWFDDDNDTELLKLVGFLRHAFAAEDVRSVIKEHFLTHVLVDKARKGIEIDLSAPPF